MTYLEEIERHIARFPGMPSLCSKLMKYLNDPEADFGRITEMIKYDPGLTANILKFANSVYFGAVQKVNSLQAALVRLGFKTIRDLVFSLSVSSRLVPGLPGYGLEAKELLKHSIWTAVAAEELARILDLKRVDMIFTTGLMHDLGMLLMDPFVLRENERFKQFLGKENACLDHAEREILGMDHARAGAAILANWQTGPEIVAGVRWHHEPERATEHQELVHLVHLADMLAFAGGIGVGNYGMQYKVSPETVEILHLKKEHVEHASSKSLDKMKELESIMG